MKQTRRRFLALVPAFVLMMGLALPRDRVHEICVIGGDIVYCAPYDR
jgi:hypothetical protein